MSGFSKKSYLAFLQDDLSFGCEPGDCDSEVAAAAAAAAASPSEVDERVQKLSHIGRDGDGAASPPLVAIDTMRTLANCLPQTPTTPSPFRPDTPTARALDAEGPQELRRHVGPMAARTMSVHDELHRHRGAVGARTHAGAAITRTLEHLRQVGGLLGYAQKTNDYVDIVSHSNREQHAELVRLRERVECDDMRRDADADVVIGRLRKDLEAETNAKRRLQEQNDDLRAVLGNADRRANSLWAVIAPPASSVPPSTASRARARSRSRERVVAIGADGKAHRKTPAGAGAGARGRGRRMPRA
jgi:cell division septum initiation protein DivIVA